MKEVESNATEEGQIKPPTDKKYATDIFFRENQGVIAEILTKNKLMGDLESQKNLQSGKKKKIVENMIDGYKKRKDYLLDDLVLEIRGLAGKDVFPNDQEISAFEEMKIKMAPAHDQENAKRQTDALRKHNDLISFLMKDLRLLDPDLINLIDKRIAEQARERQKQSEASEGKKKATEQKDKKRIEEIRENLEQEQEIKGEDYFDPEKELQKIRSEIFAENFLSQDEKKEKMRSYKDKLMIQKMGIASINNHLERYLLEKYDFDEKELLSIFEKETERYKLAPFQIERYKLAFEKIRERMKIVDYYDKSFEGKSEEEKYENIFGFKPEGPVRIEKNRLCFTVWCKSSKDYANIFSAGTKGEMKESLQKKADYSGGVANIYTALPELRGAVIAIRYNEGQNANSIFVHEEKHVLNGIIRPATEADKAWYLKDHRGDFNRPADFEKLRILLEFRADYIRERSRDELLAYIKDGRAAFDILATLEREDEKGGLYDYYKQDESICPVSNDLKNIFSSDEINEVRLKYKKRYLEEFKRAIVAVSEFEEIGFDRDAIVAIFQAEDMKYWPKILMRLKQNEKFQNLIAEIAQKRLGEIKDRIMKLTGLIESLTGRTYSEKFFKLFDPKSGKIAKAYEQERAALQFRQDFLEEIIENAKKETNK